MSSFAEALVQDQSLRPTTFAGTKNSVLTLVLDQTLDESLSES